MNPTGPTTKRLLRAIAELRAEIPPGVMERFTTDVGHAARHLLLVHHDLEAGSDEPFRHLTEDDMRVLRACVEGRDMALEMVIGALTADVERAKENN